MRTIWKYNIDLLDLVGTDLMQIEMPHESKILHVDCQMKNVISFWAEIPDGDRILVNRQFQVVGTGQGIVRKKSEYIGTVLDGEFVWHLYEWI